MAFMNGRLKIAPNLSETPVFLRELENFKMKISPGLGILFSAWRDRDHDDLVMSVAMAVWYCDAVRLKKSKHFIIGGERR